MSVIPNEPEEITAFRNELLDKLYWQLTIEQQQFFNRMYGSLNSIPEEKKNWAIQQCKRTIAKNVIKNGADVSSFGEPSEWQKETREERKID